MTENVAQFQLLFLHSIICLHFLLKSHLRIILQLLIKYSEIVSKTSPKTASDLQLFLASFALVVHPASYTAYTAPLPSIYYYLMLPSPTCSSSSFYRRLFLLLPPKWGPFDFLQSPASPSASYTHLQLLLLPPLQVYRRHVGLPRSADRCPARVSHIPAALQPIRVHLPQ